MPGKGNPLLDSNDQNKWARGDGPADQPTTEPVAEPALKETHGEDHDGGDYYFDPEESCKHHGGRYPRTALK